MPIEKYIKKIQIESRVMAPVPNIGLSTEVSPATAAEPADARSNGSNLTVMFGMVPPLGQRVNETPRFGQHQSPLDQNSGLRYLSHRWFRSANQLIEPPTKAGVRSQYS